MKEGEVKEESASSIPRILQSAQAQQLAESATTRRIGMRTKKISARLLQATAAAVATTTAHRNGSWSTDNEKACHNHQNNATVENSDDGSESLHHRVNAASQASINNNDDAVFRTAVRAGPKPPVLFARTPALQRTRTKQGSSSSTGAASRGSHSRRTTPATQDSTLTRKEESIFSKCRRTAKPAVKKKKEAIAAPAKRKRTTAVSFFSSNMLQQDAEEESKSTCTMNLLYPEKEKRFLLSNKKVKAAATDLRTRVAAQTLVQLAKGSLCRRSQQQQNQLVISFDTLATAAVHNVQLSPPNDYETPTTSESSVCLSEPGSQQLACSSHQYNAPLPTMIAATLPAALSSLSIDAPTSLEPHTLPSIGTASAPSTTVRNVNDLDVTSANGTSAEVSVEQGDGYREVIQQHQPVTMERCTSSRLPSTSSVTILSTMSRKDVASNGSIPLSDALVATDSGLAMVRSEPTPMSSSLSCHLEGDAVATEDDFACIHTELPDELLELPGELTCAASRTAINFLEQAIHFLEQADRAAWVDREEKDLNASSSAELVEPAGRHMEAAEYCVATADDEKSEQESKSAVGEAPDASTVSSGRVAPDNNVAFTVQNPTAKVNSKEAAVMRTCNFDTESGETLSRSKIIALTLVVEKESNEGGLVKCDRVMTKYPAVTAVNIDSRVAESGPLEVTSNDILEASGHVPLTSMTEQNDDLTAVTTMESDEADENEIPCSQAALSNKLLTKPDIASSPTCFVMAFLHSSEPNDELQALTPSCSVDVAVPETVVSEHGVPVTARPGPPSTENDASHNHFESKQMVSVKIPSSAGFFLAEAAEQVQSTSMETVFREGMNHVMEQFVDDTAANLTDVSSIGSEVDDALQPSLSRKKRRLETLPKEGNDITLKDSASCPGMRTARSEPKQWIKFPIGTKVVKVRCSK